MRLATSTVVLGLLVACATAETPDEGMDDPFTSAGTGGTSAGSGGTGPGTGGTSAGSSSGGTFFSGGGASAGGTDFTSSGSGGAPAGGAGAGGKGGSGGAGAGAGGKGGAGGAGGKGGAGGMGGGTAVGCPAKTTWEATASIYAMDCATPDDTGAYCGPPARAIDGVSNNRFTTGAARTGNEWLQIDFKVPVDIKKITLTTASGSTDYTLAYAIRIGNDPGTLAASAPVTTGTGMQGTTTITLPAVTTGRYLRINQTMAMSGWWSVAEMNVECQ